MYLSDNIIKDFLIYGSETDVKSKWLDWQEPSFLTFYLDFISPLKENIESFEQYPQGLFLPETDSNSIINYLKNRRETYRAELIKEFQKGFLEVATKMPWYFQKISGLSGLWNIDPQKYNRTKDIEIEIETLESVDLKMNYILDCYRNAVFDFKYMNWIVPENLRQFSMNINISEIRNLKLSKNSTLSPDLNPLVESKRSYPVSFREFNSLATFLQFQLNYCEISLKSTGGAFIDSFETGTSQNITNKFIILPGVISNTNQYGLLNAIIKDTKWVFERNMNEEDRKKQFTISTPEVENFIKNSKKTLNYNIDLYNQKANSLFGDSDEIPEKEIKDNPTAGLPDNKKNLKDVFTNSLNSGKDKLVNATKGVLPPSLSTFANGASPNTIKETFLNAAENQLTNLTNSLIANALLTGIELFSPLLNPSENPYNNRNLGNVEFDNSSTRKPDNTVIFDNTQIGEPDNNVTFDISNPGKPDDTVSFNTNPPGKPDDTVSFNTTPPGEPDNNVTFNIPAPGEPDNNVTFNIPEPGEPDNNVTFNIPAPGEPDDNVTFNIPSFGEPDDNVMFNIPQIGKPDDNVTFNIPSSGEPDDKVEIPNVEKKQINGKIETEIIEKDNKLGSVIFENPIVNNSKLASKIDIDNADVKSLQNSNIELEKNAITKDIANSIEIENPILNKEIISLEIEKPILTGKLERNIQFENVEISSKLDDKITKENAVNLGSLGDKIIIDEVDKKEISTDKVIQNFIIDNRSLSEKVDLEIENQPELTVDKVEFDTTPPGKIQDRDKDHGFEFDKC